jgi:hypothetical protein
MHIIKKYPQLSLLIAIYAISFFFIEVASPQEIAMKVAPYGVIAIFINGIMYTYGFTSVIATILFPLFGLYFPAYLVAIVGGLGASFGDTTILKYIKGGLHTELDTLSKTRFVRKVGKLLGFTHPWFIALLGVIILSSPLPDELGALLIARSNKIPTKYFSIISFIGNTTAIYLLTRILDAAIN